MLKSIQGIYRGGRVELSETPADIGEARVIVTFLPADGPINLRDLGIGEEEAARMRAEFATFAEDWERPEMDVYNDM
jgi:hypothetical protein